MVSNSTEPPNKTPIILVKTFQMGGTLGIPNHQAKPLILTYLSQLQCTSCGLALRGSELLPLSLGWKGVKGGGGDGEVEGCFNLSPNWTGILGSES